jgi:ATP-binding protein involved in chromosome partitioning
MPAPSPTSRARCAAADRRPGFRQGIVDLGFVKNLASIWNVSFTIELTTPACPVKAGSRGRASGSGSAARCQLRRRDDDREHAAAPSPRARIGRWLPGVHNTIGVASGKGGVGKRSR